VADPRRAGRVDRNDAEDATVNLLMALGYDIMDPALRDTPGRVARAWMEFLDGDGFTSRTFHVERSDEMVVLRGITGWSMCEHHLLPFSYTATVAYVPSDDQVLGVSKLARFVREAGGALQLQERMGVQVADAIEQAVPTAGVAVRLQGVHLCMVMRGVKAAEAEFVTTVLRGVLQAPAARAEFLAAASS